MSFFDRDFFKFTFQFLGIVLFGIVLISYVSGLNLNSNTTAGVIDGQ